MVLHPTISATVTASLKAGPVPALDRHTTALVVAQEVVWHTFSPRLSMTDATWLASSDPKLKPNIDTDVPPLVGLLEVMSVMTAESYVNTSVLDPTIPSIVNALVRTFPMPAAVVQCAEVVEIQSIDTQLLAPMAPTTGLSFRARASPKLVPMMDTVEDPKVGALVSVTNVKTGASYVKAAAPVPAWAVIVIESALATPFPAGLWQRTALVVLQIEVAHALPPTLIDGVKSAEPKFVPEIVIDAPDVVGAFHGFTKVTTGESYEKAKKPVPSTELTVWIALCASPEPGATLHRMEVCAIQTDCSQVVAPIRMVGVRFTVTKFIPTTVMLVSLDKGAFGEIKSLITGESKVKISSLVPTTLESCTAKSCLR